MRAKATADRAGGCSARDGAPAYRRIPFHCSSRAGQTKIDGAPDTILVDRDVVAVIRAQQGWALARFRERADDPDAKPRYLFLAATRNRHGARPYPFGTIAKKLARFSELIAVTDGQGRPVTLSETHRFRHTKATTLLNAGVPLHVVQRYLGHLSPAMTMHYARTLQATHEREFLRFKKVTADGRDLELEVNLEQVQQAEQAA